MEQGIVMSYAIIVCNKRGWLVAILYFPFRRTKISHQIVETQDHMAMIKMEPNNRFTPVCHAWGTASGHVHAYEINLNWKTVKNIDKAFLLSQ